MCRICLEESNEMIDIHSNQNSLQLSIAEMVSICTNVKVEENDLISCLVCSTCTEEIIQATKFRLKFNKSYKLLNEYLLKVNSKDEDSDQIVIINTIRDSFKSDTVEIYAEEEIDKDKPGNEKMYKCKKCGEGFDSKVERIRHQRVFKHYIRKTVICSKCNLQIPIQNYKMHYSKHFKCLKCKLCDKTFSNNFNLQRHMHIHSNAKPYKCNVCNAKFARQDKLKEHILLHNNDLCKQPLNENRCEKYQRVLSCNFCSKTFALVKSLNTHLLLHTDKSVICTHCGKLYPNEKKLNDHIMSVHRKDLGQSKQFLCNICANQYSSKISLQRHILNHMGLAKRFQCDICQKAFTQAQSLQLHIKIHTGEKPFVCHICSKSFNKTFNFNRHLKIHNNVKLHKCTICEKSFSCKQTLIVHIRTHTGQKPYACDFCGTISKFSKSLSACKCPTVEDIDSQNSSTNSHVPISKRKIELISYLLAKIFNISY
ncbi:hypothetical protein RN001_012665 [Aquatica leii]|uniref:Uncharacterized protein n=1 Tax=Aquatica leii TaxID=1421715 RepID=A0AAN7QFG5_9COLE|nr:hypothetical protein RN001_012665 [Aquatica leii]